MKNNNDPLKVFVLGICIGLVIAELMLILLT